MFFGRPPCRRRPWPASCSPAPTARPCWVGSRPRGVGPGGHPGLTERRGHRVIAGGRRPARPGALPRRTARARDRHRARQPLGHGLHARRPGADHRDPRPRPALLARARARHGGHGADAPRGRGRPARRGHRSRVPPQPLRLPVPQPRRRERGHPLPVRGRSPGRRAEHRHGDRLRPVPRRRPHPLRTRPPPLHHERRLRPRRARPAGRPERQDPAHGPGGLPRRRRPAADVLHRPPQPPGPRLAAAHAPPGRHRAWSDRQRRDQPRPPRPELRLAGGGGPGAPGRLRGAARAVLAGDRALGRHVREAARLALDRELPGGRAARPAAAAHPFGRTLAPAGQEVLFENRFGRLRSVVEGPDGALYLLTSNTGSSRGPQDDRLVRVVPPAG